MKSYLMRIFLIFSLGLALFQLNGQGQSVDYDKANQPMHTRTIPPQHQDYATDNASVNSKSYGNRNLGSEGSMYLMDDWCTGTVVLYDNTVFSGIKLRYNVYFQQMQFIEDGDTLAFANPDEIKSIIMDGREFIHCDYLDEGTIRKGYFEIIVEGNCRLLARNVVSYHEKDVAGINCTRDVFYKSCNFYLKKEDRPATAISCKKRAVCRALSDKEGQIKAFVRENRLRLKTKEEVARVVQYYNTLL
jgi:hypothetical protein